MAQQKQVIALAARAKTAAIFLEDSHIKDLLMEAKSRGSRLWNGLF